MLNKGVPWLLWGTTTLLNRLHQRRINKFVLLRIMLTGRSVCQARQLLASQSWMRRDILQENIIHLISYRLSIRSRKVPLMRACYLIRAVRGQQVQVSQNISRRAVASLDLPKHPLVTPCPRQDSRWVKWPRLTLTPHHSGTSGRTPAIQLPHLGCRDPLRDKGQTHLQFCLLAQASPTQQEPSQRSSWTSLRPLRLTWGSSTGSD